MENIKKEEGGKKGKKVALIVVIVLLIFGGLWVLAASLAPVPSAPPVETTIRLDSYPDGEDVSWVPVRIRIPEKSGLSGWEEILDPTNYKKLDTDKASRISFDIADYEWVMIEIDPDDETYFANAYYFIAGGENAENYEIVLYVFHLSSDVNFNALDRDTLDPITLNFTDSNTILMTADFPRASSNELHKGAGWETSTSEYSDMSASEQAEYQDQRNWRTQAVIYNPSVDTSGHYDSELRQMTETFGYKFTLNDTIDQTEADYSVDLTLDDEYEDNWAVEYGTTEIYLISLKNLSAPFDCAFTLTLGDNITCTNVQNGRATIPDNTVSAFSVYSAIGA